MKNNNSTFAAALGAAAVLSAGSAGAATLDFIGHIDNVSGERAVELAPSLNPFSSAYVPIATTAMGYSGSAATGITGSDPYAYFDRGQAGIGVCKVLVGNQCNPTSDDNVTAGEILGLSWGTSVLLHSLSFRGESHPSDPPFLATDKFDYSIDGGVNWFTKTLLNAKSQGAVDFGGVLLGANQEILLAFNNEQFYVSAAEITAVPIPAAAWLLGSGLIGLFSIGRRRKAGAVGA
jgi:hypothetical protein